MVPARKVSPFRLTSLLRTQKDPDLALRLFRNPNPDAKATPRAASSQRPFRYSARSYDLIVTKLGRARMFPEMEQIVEQMRQETRFSPKEILFCNVIASYGRARLPDPAVRTFHRIPSFGCRRTIRSFNSLLHALLNCRRFSGIEELCGDIDSYGLIPDACTYNIVMNAYCSLGLLDDARDLFDEMRSRGIPPNVTTFGTLISALCSNSMLEKAFGMKEKMLKAHNVRPNAFVYTSLIKGLCKVNELDTALQLKEEMCTGKEAGLDTAVCSTLIRALFAAGRKREVVGLLEEMRECRLEPDTVCYNAMMAGFCGENDFAAAFEVLNEMARKGCKADVVSYNVILSGLCRHGRWREAKELFDDMPRRGCLPDIVSYRTLFGGLCECRQYKDSTLLFDEMVFKGYRPRVESVHRIVDGLCEEDDIELLIFVLTIAAKGKCIDLYIWEMLTQRISKEFDLVKARELADHLRVL
uniref:Putative pentatricopeptide repeat-containing protein At1g53330 n=1 Tax=Anthurium amnicola TaxID=1678845 RepID=A0A1D1YMB0_9ARAE